jgi:hypothetical protein
MEIQASFISMLRDEPELRRRARHAASAYATFEANGYSTPDSETANAAKESFDLLALRLRVKYCMEITLSQVLYCLHGTPKPGSRSSFPSFFYSL